MNYSDKVHYKCLTPIRIRAENGLYMFVPCGTCKLCKIRRCRQWALRLNHHALFSSNCYFVTLTYDDEHLPMYTNDFLGITIPTVCKEDLQKFVRKIRDYYKHDCDISYFAGSEYGPETGRPHYHILMYNLPSELLEPRQGHTKDEPLFKTIVGHPSMINRKISDFWKKGFVTVGEYCKERVGYMANYFVNKQDTPYENMISSVRKATRNFSLMSKGIGLEYVNRNKSYLLNYGSSSLKSVHGTYVQTPRYYKDKLGICDKSYLDQIEEINKSFYEPLDSHVLREDIEYQINAKSRFHNKKQL